jgi:hypothetical protein
MSSITLADLQRHWESVTANSVLDYAVLRFLTQSASVTSLRL